MNKTVKNPSDKTDPGVKVERKSDGSVSFPVTIPKSTVKQEYDLVLTRSASQVELKGFRKGKAPIKLVEENLGKQKLYTQVLQQLLPKVYANQIKKLNLKPISNPKIEPKSIEEDKDWQLIITIAEKPEIKLGNYKQVVSAALAASKIWVPGKDAAEENQPKAAETAEPQQSTDEKIAKVFDALLNHVELTLPELVLEEELNRLLSQLVQQMEKLGLTIDQYLASLRKSSDQLRQEYRQQAERNLKLELILNEIAIDLKIKVDENEINQLIQTVKDEKLRKNLSKPPERANIAVSLRKRKTLDALIRM